MLVTLEGQVGIVTGAGSPKGIGRALALELAKSGALVVYACDLNIDAVSSLSKEVKVLGLGCEIYGQRLDVSNEEQTIDVIQLVLKKHGRFDFFFANAGYALYRYAKSIAKMLGLLKYTNIETYPIQILHNTNEQ